MDITTLEKANQLDKKIRGLSEVLDCFEWNPGEDEKPISLYPRIIIEYNNSHGNRDQQPLSMGLNKELATFLKAEIVKIRDSAVTEFNAL